MPRVKLPPGEAMVQINFQVKPSDKERLEALARSMNMKMSELVRYLILKEVKR